MKTKTIVLGSVAASAMFLAGCVSTFDKVEPLTGGTPPKERPKVLALGDIKVADTRWSSSEQKMMLHAFQLGLEKWCAENRPDVRVEGVFTNGTPETVVVNGIITEIEKGSAAARFWVGMGAGQQRAQGDFVINAADGTKLTSFVARKSYLGGQGIGGWDMMSIQDLVIQLGQLVAETTDKWFRGEKIK